MKSEERRVKNCVEYVGKHVFRWGVYSFIRSTLRRWVQGLRSKVKGSKFNSHRSRLMLLSLLTKEASENVCLIIVLQTFTDPSTTLRMTETAWTWNHQTSLHPLIIISTFLFPLYFIKAERFVTGRFMHKYTVDESRKMLMGCVIVVGNKVANVLTYEINLKSGQIILKR